jgi:hypothetical protein
VGVQESEEEMKVDTRRQSAREYGAGKKRKRKTNEKMGTGKLDHAHQEARYLVKVTGGFFWDRRHHKIDPIWEEDIDDLIKNHPLGSEMEVYELRRVKR